MARPWLRLYRKIVESKKAHDLHPTMFKAWIMLLACTNDDGNLPSPEQLSFKLRQPEIRINAWLETLARLRFLDETETGYAAHDWCDWNFINDGNDPMILGPIPVLTPYPFPDAGVFVAPYAFGVVHLTSNHRPTTLNRLL